MAMVTLLQQINFSGQPCLLVLQDNHSDFLSHFPLN
jgi:hypothetical protein